MTGHARVGSDTGDLEGSQVDVLHRPGAQSCAARGRPRLASGAACLGMRPASFEAFRRSTSIWALTLRSSSLAQRLMAS